jgi:hypothetical protein
MLTETAFIDGHDYTFQQLRRVLRLPAVQEGVLAAGDYKVSAGAGMSVNVAAGDALVAMDTGTKNGLYWQENDAAIAGVVVPPSHATLPRIDQVLLQVRDPNVVGAFDTPQLFVLQGVPTAGATLDNRNGAIALPGDHLRLADVLVPAASGSVSAGNVRDRRRWARGAHTYVTDAATGTFTVTPAGVFTEITVPKFRIELTGVPVDIEIIGAAAANAGAAGAVNAILIKPFLNGSEINAGETLPPASGLFSQPAGAGAFFGFHSRHLISAPGSGSYLVSAGVSALDTSATVQVGRNALSPLRLIVRELVRQDANNT